MSDEVAIVTKARENIIFAMSELPARRRIELSHKKRELIQKCSFNGAECNIDKLVPIPYAYLFISDVPW